MALRSRFYVSLGLLLLAGSSTAFVLVRPPRAARPSRLSALPPLADLTDTALNTFTVASNGQLVQSTMIDTNNVAALSSTSIALSDGWEILKTVALGLTGIIFALAGLAYLAASVLIPKAAEQLEKETKELAPELWAEYEAKLEEGETIAMRPDLMQELGNKIQPLIEQKIEAQVQQNDAVMSNLDSATQQPVSPAAPVNEVTSVANAMDAEIVDDEEDIEEKRIQI